MLSLSNVTLEKKLKDISLTLDGKSLCVISESNETLTAFADTVCGIKKPSAGNVQLNERVPLLAVGAPLPSFMTVKEYLDTVMSACGITALPQFVYENAKPLFNKRIGGLSALQKTKVGIFSSLTAEAEFIFAEKPTDGLNPDEASDVLSLLLSDGHESYAIYTSFSLSDVMRADLVLALDKGQTAFFGTPADFCEKASGSGSLTVRLMGDAKKLGQIFASVNAEIAPDEKKGVYLVTLPEGFSGADVKDMIKGTGVTFLDAKKDNERLSHLLSLLGRTDKKKNEEYELQKEELSGPKKIDISLTAFSRELDNDPYSDADEDDGETEENDGGESTLFSSKK